MLARASQGALGGANDSRPGMSRKEKDAELPFLPFAFSSSKPSRAGLSCSMLSPYQSDPYTASGIDSACIETSWRIPIWMICFYTRRSLVYVGIARQNPRIGRANAVEGRDFNAAMANSHERRLNLSSLGADVDPVRNIRRRPNFSTVQSQNLVTSKIAKAHRWNLVETNALFR